MKPTIALVGALALASCQPQQTYVIADRLTYEAVAPEYLEYVNADPRFDVNDAARAQRARRVRTIDTWRMRLEAAEGRR